MRVVHRAGMTQSDTFRNGSSVSHPVPLSITMQGRIYRNLPMMARFPVVSFIFMVSFSRAAFQEFEVMPLEMVPATNTFSLKDLETYIVHVSLPAGVSSTNLEDLQHWYHSFMPKTRGGQNYPPT